MMDRLRCLIISCPETPEEEEAQAVREVRKVVEKHNRERGLLLDEIIRLDRMNEQSAIAKALIRARDQGLS